MNDELRLYALVGVITNNKIRKLLVITPTRAKTPTTANMAAYNKRNPPTLVILE
jgi:hypothetical protein